MKRATICLATILSIGNVAIGQVIISDTYDVTGNNSASTGFGVNSGVNTEIATRLTGTAATGLSYINMNTKADDQYSIVDNKLRGNGGAGVGAFTLSADGISGFNFSSALGATTATPADPVQYTVALGMANNLLGGPRFSFGLMTTTPVDGAGSAGLWDFGIQLDRANGSTSSGVTAYDVFGRIDDESRIQDGDDNFLIQNLGDGSYGTEVNVVLRITDAGAESDAYNSKVEVSLDGGNSFIFSTAPNEFRFDGADRFFMWDFASNGTGDRGYGTYDDFSVTVVPEPSTFALLALGGIGAFWSYRRRNS